MAEKKTIDALKLKEQLRSNFYTKYYSNRSLLRKKVAESMADFMKDSSSKQPNT